MTHNPRPAVALSKKAGTLALAVAGTADGFGQGQPPARRVEELISGIRSTNDAVSSAACDSAPEYGPSAVRPLAFTMADKDFEVARKARRALYKLVRQASRPGAGTEAVALETKLAGVLHSRTPLPVPVRREILWMISEIGAVRAVQPVAELLADKDLREDARCVLIRLPFPEAVTALKSAFASAPEEFKHALADALRARGEKVEGYPSRKMVPTAATTVLPAQPKK